MALVSDSYTLLDRITEQMRLIVEPKKNPRTTPPSDEKPECTVQKGKVVSGNVNSHIERLCTTPNDAFLMLFISSYPSFVSSHELCSKLIERHGSADAAGKSNIIEVLDTVVGHTFDEFSQETEDMVFRFFSTDGIDSRYAQNCTHKSTIKKYNIVLMLIPPINFFIPEEPVSPTPILISVGPIEVPRQLTIIDAEMHKKVKVTEFVKLKPGTPSRTRITRYSHIVDMTKRIDDIANWTAMTIHLFRDLPCRVVMLRRFIEIAEHIEEVNNFQSLAGICKGFYLEPVLRHSVEFTHSVELDDVTQLDAIQLTRTFDGLVLLLIVAIDVTIHRVIHRLTLSHPINPSLVFNSSFLSSVYLPYSSSAFLCSLPHSSPSGHCSLILINLFVHLFLALQLLVPYVCRHASGNSAFPTSRHHMTEETNHIWPFSPQ